MTRVRPWQLISSSVALDEKWFQVRKDVVKLPSGKIIDDYFLWEGPDIATVVPVTPEGKFVLVRQYRHAINKILLQFPAGGVDPGESREKSAARELREETGYISGKEIVHLGSLSPYCTKLTSVDEIFIALDVRPEGAPHYDEQEETEIVVLDREALLALIDKPEIHCSSSLVGAAFLALRYLDNYAAP